MASTGTAFKPFHESIVERIEVASREQLIGYGPLLTATTIPANHDKIIEVWRRRCEFVGFTGTEMMLVVSIIEIQKHQSR